VKLEALFAEGFIHETDLKLFSYADNAEEAWEIVRVRD
jgi:hypothetical protein